MVVDADFADCQLKEAVVAHLKGKGGKLPDPDVTATAIPAIRKNMIHRVGLRVGQNFGRRIRAGLIFCGTETGIRIMASKCPHV